ncbi:chitobiase/beta-hexosaminidase C-terminal domain-containing protein [Chryseobacterium chendengshani]|uniref:chitobiase/beta-hexosaminidase C-terminal domain-containing protein n=1 Tax=Chryseobacterium sp. LJ668 TaxID=2864040 RepID=UPI001C68DA7B|nr:chitobiase/beta-hexosaminidase C-terminal domain-containing protein [Chryseobacterium sp. LJ668]MBW8523443.1 chitobiase/beta-hexosaminidase C-terminal domain-containing protein [Chryseobacterium sp. LJ668]QYK15730.1 chitobiase/beta-hexosaminidase C-terminal domain-containing protein [Chryseobacterium sp. LJ668]
MKKKLFSVFIFISIFCSSQINMIPAGTHYDNAYPVTISGNGTIYYTTDGSTPTFSSSSGTNNVQITINQNKEIKAFLMDGQGNVSPVFARKYYTGTLPLATIYFKPPSTWTNGACVITDMVNPNSVNGGVVDIFWPGPQMQNTGCDGWYKFGGYYENANLTFTNCFMMNIPPAAISTNTIPAGSIIYYDFTNGAISNPPSCLFLSTSENKSRNFMMVKIYPNPVTDILKINSNIDFRAYEIVDISGKIISSNKFSSKEISVTHIISGNYFIKLKDGKGNETLLKFLKK